MWQCLATLTPLERTRPLWRISVQPRHAAEFTGEFRDKEAVWLFDWAGGNNILAGAGARLFRFWA